MDRLRIAVVGLGPMGLVHVSNVANLPSVRLHAVGSRRPDIAQEVAQRYQANRFYLEAIDQTLAAVEEAGVYLQVGFMRRFDPGYVAAKKKIEEGAIGCPVMFKGVSRDPFWPEKQDGPGYKRPAGERIAEAH